MKWNPPSRRQFLQGAAGATLALPFLESLAPREARAAGPAKRFIAMKTYDHPVVANWYPTKYSDVRATKYASSSTKRDGTALLTTPLEPGSKYMAAPLTEFMSPTGISKTFGANFNKHLPKLTMIRGLDFLPDTNHNYSGFLGNYASCDEATPVPATLALPKWPTIDQVLAQSAKFYGSTPAVRSLHVGQGITKGVSWAPMGANSATQLNQRTNPLDAYNDLFAGFNGGGMTATGPTPRQMKDAILVDKVFQDYKRLKASPRLSGADKQLLDQYINMMAELQEKLKRTQTVSCTKPGAPASLPNNAALDPSDIKMKWDLFIDSIVAAIMCDRTRVVTLDVRKALVNAGAGGLYHDPNGNGGSWHGLAHTWDASAQARITEANTWVANNVFLKLIEKLDVVESGGATYLDNSLIYWGGELGGNHLNYSVHCMLAGSAGGAIKPGRFIDYIDWDGRAYFGGPVQMGAIVIAGIPHNRFCVSVLQAMGLSPADYERSGIPGFGERALINKPASTHATEYDFGKIGQPLPGLHT